MLLRHLIVALLLLLLPRFALGIQGAGALCICIVVKNDDAVIWKCLESIEEIADCICICDTGSEDHTLTAVHEFVEKTGIPHRIIHQKVKNFEKNPLLALHAGQKTLNDFGVPLAQSYI
ncbi:MAG: hypothetical protein ACHQT8_07850, partial [Chlamydiales bacterium]